MYMPPCPGRACNMRPFRSYQLVLQLNHPPYAWSKAAQEDFQHYMDEGQGSYIGFHHATLLGEFDGYRMWDWFSDFMGGIRYQNYIAEKCDAAVVREDARHPVMHARRAADLSHLGR